MSKIWTLVRHCEKSNEYFYMPFVPARSGNLGCQLSKIIALRCDKRPRNLQIRRKNHSFFTFDAHKKKSGQKLNIISPYVFAEFYSEQVQIRPVKLGQKLKRKFQFEKTTTDRRRRQTPCIIYLPEQLRLKNDNSSTPPPLRS